MNYLYEVIYYFLLGDKDLNNEVKIEMPNHVTILTYFSKRTRAKPVEQQLSFHTDNIYNNDGTFDHKQNSLLTGNDAIGGDDLHGVDNSGRAKNSQRSQ